MSDNTAPQTWVLPEGSVRNLAISLDGLLDTTETLATVLVQEMTSEDLTIENVAVSVAELQINHRAVALGRAVQATVSGMLTATENYTLRVTGVTDSTPAQSVIGFIRFECADR